MSSGHLKSRPRIRMTYFSITLKALIDTYIVLKGNPLASGAWITMIITSALKYSFFPVTTYMQS